MLVNSHPVGLAVIQRAQKEVEEFGPFAVTTVRNKYAHTKKSGYKESWQEISARVAAAVVRPYLPHLESAAYRLILQRKLMPGGRYLYAAGRRFPQISNCFLYRAEDSREGWAELLNKCAHSLMTGGGVGVVYSDVRPADSDIQGMGGKSTGPIALMNMINECGRHIVQGGSRRSALWAGLHWWHPDVFRFITCKRYSALIKECKERDFNFPAPMDGTNISVITDDDFFAAMNDVSWSKEYRLWGAVHTVTHAWAKRVYEQVTFGMCTDGEPGLSVDTGENAGECLRNACLTGDTLVAVADGRGAVPIRDLVGLHTTVYASDGSGGIVRAVMRNVRVTRRQAAVVRVTLDDGSSVRVTPDHLMMLADGSFAEAGTLTPGACLMPFFSQVRQDYRRVRCPA